MIQRMIITVVYLLPALVSFYCSVEDMNPVAPGFAPNITDISIADKWNTLITLPYKVEVRVSDPQGTVTLEYVIMNVKSSTEVVIFSDTLFDDGSVYHPQSGDVFAGDGFFSNRFQPNDITNLTDQATYLFEFIAFDRQGNASQVMERQVLFGPNQAPQIIAVNTPDTVAGSPGEVIITVTVSDSNGIDDIVRVFFESEDLRRNFTKFENDLYNSGDFQAHGDLTAEDSVFSTRLSSEFLSGKQGDYRLHFYAEDSYGESNKNAATKSVFVGNLPGTIEQVSLPGTINLPATGINQALMTAKVSDPEGLADVDSVYFYSLKPDSTYANNGLPLVMVDNGLPFNINNPLVEAGDAIAADGEYSFMLLVDSSTVPGIYRFSFFLRDKAGNLTGPVARTINILKN